MPKQEKNASRGALLKAIELYWKIERYSNNIDKLNEELANVVTKLPGEQMEEYLFKTSEESKESGVCILCGGEYHHYGNNPSPIIEYGRCCDKCNNHVIAARIKKVMNKKGEK